ncbi:Rieske (2Fe-2S) protein [Cryobacterium suzukii]|uniref:Cytochrome bc1 complex Rieske iron-sulfur subunit n=1 Tax=Cryobacterium suzukii TaxID=1259198 RepID=A0A4R9ACT8_9MICO|nr:Rieske (2Fe-2S) protein [Cryobacterium suzukii]TFD58142.1 Rieske (2Fe-2S) protein [Cryobacterium suzukii]
MTPATDLSRRAVILIGSAGTAAVLAGCSTESSAGVEAGGQTAASAGAPQEVAKLADIPVGGSISATLEGKPILVSQPTEGSVIAFSAICTHQGCVVKPGGSEFDCPCHQSRFNGATGEVLDGPAPSPLEKIAVHVTGGVVLTSRR